MSDELICPNCRRPVASEFHLSGKQYYMFLGVNGSCNLTREQAEILLQANALYKACQALLDYRRRNGATNFQLEKADDFMNKISIILEGGKT